MTVEKPKPRQLLRPITTGTNSAMNQSQFLAITCNSLEAREKSRVHGAIGFGFASHWLKNWRDSFKPITKRSNRNHVITSDGHLKTAVTIRRNPVNVYHQRNTRWWNWVCSATTMLQKYLRIINYWSETEISSKIWPLEPRHRKSKREKIG